MDFNSEAIVLRNIKLNETDKIVHLFSPEYGLISAIAKGAFKLDSKLAAKTQVMNHCDFHFAKGRNLDIIKEGKIINQFKQIKSDFDLTSYAYFFLDLVHQTATIEEDHIACFNLLGSSLNKLNKDSVNQEELMTITANFLWELVDLLGYKPDLNHCTLTHKARKENQLPRFFALVNGGITSGIGMKEFIESYPDQQQIVPMPKEVFQILESFELKQRIDGISEKSLKSSIKLLQNHLEHKVTKDFKTKKQLPVFN